MNDDLQHDADNTIRPSDNTNPSEDLLNENENKDLNQEVNDHVLSQTKKIEIENSSFNQSPNINANGSVVVNYGKEERNGLPVPFLLEKKRIFEVNTITAKYISLLQEDQFLILNCAHEGIAYSLKESIAQNQVFDLYFKYEVSFDTYDRSHIVHLIEDCRKYILNKKTDKLLLFIHDSDYSTDPHLLNQLRNANKKDIIRNLQNDLLIIYTTYHQNSKYLDRSFFDFYRINAFTIFKKTYCITDDKAHIIKRQQAKGLWGNGEKELLKNLEKIIKFPNFDQIIRDKEEEKGTDFLSVIKDKKQPLGRYVLLVATLFPELPPDVFRDYVSLLVLEKRKIIINDQKISLLEIWEDESDLILDDCKIETHDIDNQCFVDFGFSTERNKCNQVLFKKFKLFIDQQARILIEHHQLFIKNNKQKVHERINPLVAKLSRHFKGYYGDELLKKWLQELEDQRKRIIDYHRQLRELKEFKEIIKSRIDQLKGVKNQEDGFQILEKMTPVSLKSFYHEELEKFKLMKFLLFKEENLPENASISNILEESYAYKDFILKEIRDINRDKSIAQSLLNKNVYFFVGLLTTIYEQEGTKELISNFFSDSISVIYRNYILLEVITKFQIKNIVFNALPYYKQTLTHRSKEVNDKGFDALCKLLLNQPSQFYSCIFNIKEWFPSDHKNNNDYTKLEEQIINALYTILWNQLVTDEKHLSTNDDWDESDTYIALFKDVENQNKHLEFVLFKVFNITTIFKNTNIDTVNNWLQNQLSKIIEYWYRLLKSIPDSENTLIKEKIQVLIIAINKALDTTQYRQLLYQLNENVYIYDKDCYTTKDLKQKEKLKKQQTSLKELITLLNV